MSHPSHSSPSAGPRAENAQNLEASSSTTAANPTRANVPSAINTRDAQKTPGTKRMSGRLNSIEPEYTLNDNIQNVTRVPKTPNTPSQSRNILSASFNGLKSIVSGSHQPASDASEQWPDTQNSQFSSYRQPSVEDEDSTSSDNYSGNNKSATPMPKAKQNVKFQTRAPQTAASSFPSSDIDSTTAQPADSVEGHPDSPTPQTWTAQTSPVAVQSQNRTAEAGPSHPLFPERGLLSQIRDQLGVLWDGGSYVNMDEVFARCAQINESIARDYGPNAITVDLDYFREVFRQAGEIIVQAVNGHPEARPAWDKLRTQISEHLVSHRYPDIGKWVFQPLDRIPIPQSVAPSSNAAQSSHAKGKRPDRAITSGSAGNGAAQQTGTGETASTMSPNNRPPIGGSGVHPGNDASRGLGGGIPPNGPPNMPPTVPPVPPGGAPGGDHVPPAYGSLPERFVPATLHRISEGIVKFLGEDWKICCYRKAGRWGYQFMIEKINDEGPYKEYWWVKCSTFGNTDHVKEQYMNHCPGAKEFQSTPFADFRNEPAEYMEIAGVVSQWRDGEEKRTLREMWWRKEAMAHVVIRIKERGRVRRWITPTRSDFIKKKGKADADEAFRRLFNESGHDATPGPKTTPSDFHFYGPPPPEQRPPAGYYPPPQGAPIFGVNGHFYTGAVPGPGQFYQAPPPFYSQNPHQSQPANPGPHNHSQAPPEQGQYYQHPAPSAPGQAQYKPVPSDGQAHYGAQSQYQAPPPAAAQPGRSVPTSQGQAPMAQDTGQHGAFPPNSQGQFPPASSAEQQGTPQNQSQPSSNEGAPKQGEPSLADLMKELKAMSNRIQNLETRVGSNSK